MKLGPLLLLLVAALVCPAVAQDTKPAATSASELKTATFAGGCFWCMQYPFDRAKGVKKTVVGYTGGKKANPTYEEVSNGDTGHAEAIEVTYDPKETTYEALLDVFWRHIDPTTLNRQFADHGTQYRTGIFYHTDEEKRLAETSKEALGKSDEYKGKPIVTEIVSAGTFYPAEDYHQAYYQKNAQRFHAYEEGSGRAPYLRKKWGDQDAGKK